MLAYCSNFCDYIFSDFFFFFFFFFYVVLLLLLLSFLFLFVPPSIFVMYLLSKEGSYNRKCKKVGIPRKHRKLPLSKNFKVSIGTEKA